METSIENDHCFISSSRLVAHALQSIGKNGCHGSVHLSAGIKANAAPDQTRPRGSARLRTNASDATEQHSHGRGLQPEIVGHTVEHERWVFREEAARASSGRRRLAFGFRF